MLRSAVRVNDFLSVNGTSTRNGIGSGIVVMVTDTQVVTYDKFINNYYVFSLEKLAQTRANMSNSDGTWFIIAKYYSEIEYMSAYTVVVTDESDCGIREELWYANKIILVHDGKVTDRYGNTGELIAQYAKDHSGNLYEVPVM